MSPFTIPWDIASNLDVLFSAGGLDEGKRILEGKTDFLEARIDDVQGALFSASIQQGKKRKRDDHLYLWMAKGRELVQKARGLLDHGEACPDKRRKVEQGICLSQTFASRFNFHRMIRTLSAHEKEADKLLRWPLSEEHGPDRGNLIPVRELYGRVASDALEKLQALLRGDEIGRIAIHGKEGLGKTFLTKHLHNSVLKGPERFNYVFWVTFPQQFSIKSVQDAIAAAVKCELCSHDNLIKRAEKLSDTIAGLGSFVLFLDAVPEALFSLVEIGIPVPAEGGMSKLVLSTRSTLVSETLDCLIVNLDRLSDAEAYQLLLNESRVTRRSASLLKSISSLAEKCNGVPRLIEDIATRMRGIDDPREWRNEEFEYGKSLKAKISHFSQLLMKTNHDNTYRSWNNRSRLFSCKSFNEYLSTLQ